MEKNKNILFDNDNKEIETNNEEVENSINENKKFIEDLIICDILGIL